MELTPQWIYCRDGMISVTPLASGGYYKRDEVDSFVATLRTKLEESEKAAYDVAGTIDALKQRLAQLEQKQRWLDEVGPPNHPDDERQWVLAYLEAKQRLAQVEQALKSYQAVLIGAEYEHVENIGTLSVEQATALGKLTAFYTKDLTVKLAMAQQERDDWQSRHAALMHHMATAQARIATLQSQLPTEMPDCTIVFKECDKGHGRLTATNWLDHGCHYCRVQALEKELEKATKLIIDMVPLSHITDDDLKWAKEQLQALTPAKEQREI